MLFRLICSYRLENQHADSTPWNLWESQVGIFLGGGKRQSSVSRARDPAWRWVRWATAAKAEGALSECRTCHSRRSTVDTLSLFVSLEAAVSSRFTNQTNISD